MRCRRSTGSAHASNVFTDPENILLLSGQELIKRYELPEAERFAKQFCSECGSLVPLVNRDGTKLIIPAGTLKHCFEAHPQKNIFWDSKAQLNEHGLESPRFGEY